MNYLVNLFFQLNAQVDREKKNAYFLRAFHSKNAIVTGIYGGSMKAYDSNANPSVEGGITKERDGMVEKKRGESTG